MGESHLLSCLTRTEVKVAGELAPSSLGVHGETIQPSPLRPAAVPWACGRGMTSPSTCPTRTRGAG